MNFTSLLLTFFLSPLLFSASTHATFAPPTTEWTWAGFEIVGLKKITKEQVIKQVPLKSGDIYKEEPLIWKTWCETLKSSFSFSDTHCSAVRYVEGQAYFVIDIIEAGDEHRNQFREAPAQDIALTSEEVLKLYDLLYARLWKLFEQGITVKETADRGFLDFSDLEMHGIVMQLIEQVPQYRDNILDVLANDKDAQKREKAANLLNWTLNVLSETQVKASVLLDDPSSEVRNNISRFTLHFIDKVTVQTHRFGMIDNLLKQLDRPSHGDRNKAIYNLLIIATKFPEDRAYIKEHGLVLIDYIARESILSNVGALAVELQKLLQP